jgi:cell shape-determining protein MreC
MTASPASQRKAAWWLAALLLGQVVLMSALAKHPESEQSLLGTWIMTPLAFVERIVNGAVSGVTGFFAGYIDLRHARAENIDLREKNDQLLGELNDLRERAVELERLRTRGCPAATC